MSFVRLKLVFFVLLSTSNVALCAFLFWQGLSYIRIEQKLASVRPVLSGFHPSIGPYLMCLTGASGLAYTVFLCFRLPGAIRRARAGSCRRCGYDLRATPAHCPECGDASSTVNP